jgi:hypothetical protein
MSALPFSALSLIWVLRCVSHVRIVSHPHHRGRPQRQKDIETRENTATVYWIQIIWYGAGRQARTDAREHPVPGSEYRT